MQGKENGGTLNNVSMKALSRDGNPSTITKLARALISFSVKTMHGQSCNPVLCQVKVVWAIPRLVSPQFQESPLLYTSNRKGFVTEIRELKCYHKKEKPRKSIFYFRIDSPFFVTKIHLILVIWFVAGPYLSLWTLLQKGLLYISNKHFSLSKVISLPRW